LLRRLTGDLDWITQKALQKDRERRYDSASEMAADIRRHLANQPVLAGPPSAIYQIRKFVQRNRASVSFSVIFLVGLFVALGVVMNLLAQRNENLARFDTLQVSLDCDQLKQEVDHEMWPAVPSRIEAMDAWLTQARKMVGQLPTIRALQDKVVAGGRPVDGNLLFDAPRDAALHAELGPLIARLEAMAADDGSIAEIEGRRAWAAGRDKLTRVDQADAWRKAIATIGDTEQCPRYKELQIVAQPGFVPLGRDEHSGLYEFAYPLEGQDLPVREQGEWSIKENTCMVFVLMPASKASIGITWPDAALPRLYPEVARPREAEFMWDDDTKASGHAEEVHLDAYFIGKYELSQSQWLAVMETNPSTYPTMGKKVVTLRHPVGGLAYLAADAAAHRFGLRLPTGAQWQHAARAGARAPWWTGYERDGWHGKENLADASWAAGLGHESSALGANEGDYSDGFPTTAPVDSGMPNPNGLHNVMGNVSELTRDIALKPAFMKPRDGDGELVVRHEADKDAALPTKRRVFRGSFMTDWLDARSTNWQTTSMTASAVVFGVRFAAPLHN
jgi:formylglycine-generating enzyme required for sulfatase activity